MQSQTKPKSNLLNIALSILLTFAFTQMTHAKPGGQDKKDNNGGSANITIYEHPTSTMAVAGDTASFNVVATVNKGPGLKYQWFLNGNEISSAKSSILTIDSVSSENEGDYYVILRSGDRSVTSERATLTLDTTKLTNAEPIAENDIATTEEDNKITLNVLANDTDADGDPLSVTSASATTGSIAINIDGSLTYTPKSNYSGIDTAVYAISDGLGGTANATINITVNAVNDAPIAVNDSVTTNEDTPVTIDVLANDSDIEDHALSITSATSTYGAISFNTDGSIFYSPATEFSGTDIIHYRITDSEDASAEAIVEVIVKATEDLRITYQPSSASVYVGDSYTLNVSAIGDGDLNYQWLKDGLEITGANQSYLSITNASEIDSGIYEVLVTDNTSTQLSNPASINVTSRPNVLISWDTPVHKEDGTSLAQSEISHFKIYYLQESTSSEQVLTVSRDTTSYNIENLDSDSYTLWITTVSTNGLEGAPSEYIQINL